MVKNAYFKHSFVLKDNILAAKAHYFEKIHVCVASMALGYAIPYMGSWAREGRGFSIMFFSYKKLKTVVTDFN